MNKKFILLLFLGLIACKGKVVQEVQTTLVKRGTFSEELTEEGTVRAVNSINITAPNISYRYGNLKITSLVNDGKEVDKGDTVIIFDPSEIKKAIITSQQQLEIANAEFEKLKATQQSEIEDLESDLEISRISQEISKINFEQAVYESDVTKKEINLKLETANIALERAKEQIENKKKIQQEDLFQKTLSIKQLTTALEDANSTVKSLFVISPGPGIAILKDNFYTNQKWQAGDQPYSGTILIELPDLNEMMAEVKINEVDITKISPGLKVEIKPDAYSDTTFSGKVIEVANLAQNKDSKTRIKVFPVQIKIEGRSGNLLPGLTVSCKIKISEITGVLYIPIESIFKDQGNEFVYVKTTSGFKRKDVKIGAVNTDFAIVIDGLAENEELALTDPFLNKDEDKSKKETNSNGK
ncbi:MAG: HlyD family efflux transporter periplasmic adaptor subunit [Bacteroidales bacterium]|nr:HlyD family efflux transporter periplasmic adaptor subunit [Bacteroidales bacterium]MDP3002589.1 HlyD family efflux transporter periplasmic adaptor subunit [Bacteroidales bacterium]